jgi:hypothetical protein
MMKNLKTILHITEFGKLRHFAAQNPHRDLNFFRNTESGFVQFYNTDLQHKKNSIVK